jgi:hypothetical protein
MCIYVQLFKENIHFFPHVCPAHTGKEGHGREVRRKGLEITNSVGDAWLLDSPHEMLTSKERKKVSCQMQGILDCVPSCLRI